MKYNDARVHSLRAEQTNCAHMHRAGSWWLVAGGEGGVFKAIVERESPPVISFCRPNRFSDRHQAGSVCSYITQPRRLSPDFLGSGMPFCSELACFHLIWLSHTLDWFWEGGKKIKSMSSNEYGSMPRILSAAVNGLGLDTMQRGQWLLLYTMGYIAWMHSRACFLLFFFLHSWTALPNWPNSLGAAFKSKLVALVSAGS